MSRSGSGGLLLGVMGPPQMSRAVILRTRAYGESDRIVTLLSEDFGKLTGIAKGARNSRRRFANCLDPFTLVRAHFRTRTTSNLVFMDSCDLLAVPGELCEPAKFAYGSYLLELVDQFTVEAEPTAEVFELLCDALAALRAGPATPGFLRSFELHLLQAAGLAPPFRECHVCRAGLVAASWFDPSAGSLKCELCAGNRERMLAVAPETLAGLATLQGLTPDAARCVPMSQQARRESAALLGHWLASHLARPLKSVSLIEALAG